MSGGLITDRVKITAFRGIASELDLDLTAPITVLFAPNGTGKTTVCEAVEWLLTGQVDRLRDKRKWSNAAVRSAFQADVAPEVYADIRLGDAPHRLWRTPDGAWIDKRAGNPKRPGDILALLAPAAAAPDRHQNNAISLRQHYLRGTRFLTYEALAILVDNSPESLTRRQDVFADLLGIRHLRDAEQTCEKYASELGPLLKEAEASARGLNDEAASLRAEVGEAETTANSTLQHITNAEEILGIVATGSHLEPRIQNLAATCASERYRQVRLAEGLDQLAVVWTRKPELDKRIEDLGKAASEALTALQTAQANRQQAESHAAEAGSAEHAVQSSLGALSAAEDVLRLKLTDVLRTAALADPHFTSSARTLGDLVEAAPETRWDESARQQRRQQIEAATAAGPRIDRLLAEQQQLSTRREQLEASIRTTEEVEQLRLTAEQSERRASDALRSAEAIAGPIAALQAAGSSVLDHQHDDETDCPLCGHDWRDRNRLLAAVASTLAAAPSIVGAARSLASGAAEEASQAKAALAAAAQAREQFEGLEREQRDLEASLASDRKQLEAIEVPLEGDARRVALERAERRLNLAQALAELSSAQISHLRAVRDDDVRFLTASTDRTALQRTLDEALRSRRAVLDERIAGASRTSAAAQVELAARASEERLRTEGLATVRRDLASAETERTRIDSLWTSVAGDTPWSSDGLAELRELNQTALSRIDEAEKHLAAARAALTAELKRTRLREVEARAKPLQTKITRLKQRLALSEGMRKSFRDSYIKTSQVQVSGLTRVVNALFLRMHANRIVDRIDLGKSDTFLRWFAPAGEANLDPTKDFSQGQRQDLALALFLARARGLGGTFFLDEPVAHLDDLNRVGLMDVLRVVALEGDGRVRLVITTASRGLARHMVEKFGALSSASSKDPVMRVVELSGNGRLGVSQTQVYPFTA